MKHYLPVAMLLFAVALVALPCPAFADGGGGSTPAPTVDPDFALAQKAIEAKDFGKAAVLLQGVVARDSKNAEAHNLLGFAERNRGNLDGAFRHYEKALALDPKHRGAHEYIGEAYLMIGNLPLAEEHLAKLDKICFFGCDEYDDLKKAITDYKASHPAQ